MQQTYQPAKARVVYGILALALVAIVGFTALLSIDLQRTHPVNPADYTETKLEDFAYEAAATMQGGKLVLTGWACIAQQQIDAVETDVVLYHAQTQQYICLPTEMQQNQQANAVLGDAVDHSYGGFYATVWPFQLAYDVSEYELCFSYRTNFRNALVHTGISLEVAA